jgi:CBS domain-containing protein
MSMGVLSCGPDDTLAAAEATMREQKVRRLPVIDEQGRLVGLLSIDDIAIAAAEEIGRDVTTEEVGSTLAAICRHRDRASESMIRT